MSDPTDQELARQKSQRENEKLSAEIRTFRAEEDKFRAEKDKIRENIKKLEFENQKLQEERQHQNSARRLEWVKALGSWAVVVLGIAALGTLVSNILSHNEESDRRVTQTVALLLKDLGHESSSVRAAGAVGLAPYVNEPVMKQAVISGLASSLGLEKNLLVQRTIARTLSKGGADVVNPLMEIINDISSEITPLFSNISSLEMDQLSLASVSVNAKLQEDLDDQIRDLRNLINSRQRAIVISAFVIREHSGCKVDGCQKCPPNFAGLPFRFFSFVGFREDFCGANFEGAQLSNTDFYKLDLTKANFADAQLHGASFRYVTLIDTKFSNAHMEKDQNRPLDVAIFEGADLTGATVDGACLAAADFRGIRAGLTPDQFRDSWAEGALFDKAFQKVLWNRGFVRGDPEKCREIQRYPR